MTLSLTPSTEVVTSTANLQYKIVQSLSNNLGTVEMRQVIIAFTLQITKPLSKDLQPLFRALQLLVPQPYPKTAACLFLEVAPQDIQFIYPGMILKVCFVVAELISRESHWLRYKFHDLFNE